MRRIIFWILVGMALGYAISNDMVGCDMNASDGRVAPWVDL